MASGIVGMFVAVKSNLRTAAAAQHSIADALRISLRGGAVSGILVVALSLIGVFAIFIAYGGFANPAQAPFTIVGFGFGASFVALFAPLVGRGFGLIASVIGIFLVRGNERQSPMTTLNIGYYITVALSIAGMFLVTNSMLNEKGGGMWFFYAGVVGILTSLAFVFITQYYTAGTWRPVKEIAEAAKTGPATTIISGVAVGFETTASSAIAIAIALFLSHWFGDQWGAQTGLPHGGIYGTAVATMGMLMSAAFILAEDTFGPITDNAGGVATMARASEETRLRTDRLDALGNTTKALTKGYAVASAALAAFLLFSAYLDKVAQLTGKPFDTVDLAKVNVFLGGFLGAMLVYLFSSLAIRAVGRAGAAIIQEVRTQFREHPGIMAGTEEPNYARVDDITTASA